MEALADGKMELSLYQKIEQAKQNRNAAILAHFYEDGDIQDIADAVGDSLYLAQQGQKSDKSTLILAGVVFMAESVKILSPEKTVLIPDRRASCSLVEGAPFEPYKNWRDKYPNHIMITYINSSAEVKSISDVICTSSNAERIINSIPRDRGILFGPDQHLGRHLAKKTGREMVLWPGSCEVHMLFSARKLFELKQEHPDAVVLAHPECEETVLAYADVIGSTSRLLSEVKQSPRRKFIVATEIGIFHQMQQARPDATLIQAPVEGSCACNECPYMKINTLENLFHALETGSPEVTVPVSIMERARVPLERMMRISNGEQIDWSTVSH